MHLLTPIQLQNSKMFSFSDAAIPWINCFTAQRILLFNDFEEVRFCYEKSGFDLGREFQFREIVFSFQKAVLISECGLGFRTAFVFRNYVERCACEPGTWITSNATASYRHLPEYGYEHSVVVHDRKFVNSEDISVHTQNVEVHSRWTKATVVQWIAIVLSTRTSDIYMYQWHLSFNFIYSTWSSAAVTSLYLGLFSLHFIWLKVRVEWELSWAK